MRDSDHEPPVLWAILNLTEDSFYAASRATIEQAVRRTELFWQQGAAVVDVGAESTRAGSKIVTHDEQLAVLLPYLAQVSAAFGKNSLRNISVDTRDIRVMREVAALGIGYINDVSGGSDEIYAWLPKADVGYVLMHTQGTPQTMQIAPQYTDVVAEVENYLLERSNLLRAAGMPREKIIWDTGIGFGKSVEHNLSLLAAHAHLRSYGFQVMAGVSRKSFIGSVLGSNMPEERLAGTLGVQAYLTLRGCDILRVHDVKEMADVLKIIAALKRHEANAAEKSENKT